MTVTIHEMQQKIKALEAELLAKRTVKNTEQATLKLQGSVIKDQENTIHHLETIIRVREFEKSQLEQQNTTLIAKLNEPPNPEDVITTCRNCARKISFTTVVPIKFYCECGKFLVAKRANWCNFEVCKFDADCFEEIWEKGLCQKHYELTHQIPTVKYSKCQAGCGLFCQTDSLDQDHRCKKCLEKNPN
jgi:hypothetical protein